MFMNFSTTRYSPIRQGDLKKVKEKKGERKRAHMGEGREEKREKGEGS